MRINKSESTSGAGGLLCRANILVVSVSVCNHLFSVITNLISQVTGGDGHFCMQLTMNNSLFMRSWQAGCCFDGY